MEHIAILRKSSGLLDRIVSGEKTIESRWYDAKCAPWDRIEAGQKIYFKNSGDLVNVHASVTRVLQFSDLNTAKIKSILEKYGEKIGIPGDWQNSFFAKVKNKKYCILIFLEKVIEIEPFHINKAGFGMMSAWLCVPDVRQIMLR